MELAGVVINEKLYRILQIFLSNKCQASIELVNLISSENLSLNYLQALSLKIAIDSSARLVHRDTGKIILPYEHWTNAIFLKHCSGPGGLHLNLESTIKAILDSYSCGKENFGFDRDFIVEVLSTCPSSTCRFSSYKGQQQPQQPPPPPPTFDQQPIPPHHQSFPPMEYGTPPTRSPLIAPIDTSKLSRPMTSQHITQQIMQQQQQHQQQQQQQQQQQHQHNRMNQSMESLEKQRVMQQLDKKHYETVAAVLQVNHQMNPTNMNMMHNINHSKIDYSRRPSYDGIETYSAGSYSTSNRELLHNNWITPNNIQPLSFDRERDGMIAGQEKIVRAFAELMKNMARMKAFIRPSMVKPYGKQSENLQKTLIDSINLVQTLRNFLPKPHISISNWKSIDQTATVDATQTIQ